MAVEDCSTRLIFGLVSSILGRKGIRARKMLKLSCSASYYIGLYHHVNVTRTKKRADSDKYMSGYTNQKFQFIKLIGGISSNAIWST
jgi:hypothetical protein